MEKVKQILSKISDAFKKAVAWFLGLQRKQQIIYASIAVVALAGTITLCCIHRHKYTATVEKPTCTEQGYTIFTCSCGESYIGSRTEAKGHTYTATVKNPTCTKQGYTTFTCYCGESYIDMYVDSLGHSFGEWYTQDSTCENQGYKIRQCNNCSEYDIVPFPLADHIESEWIVERVATCTEEGSHYKKCLNCDKVTIKETIPCLEHDYRNWYVAEHGDTCEENTYTSTCRDCKNVGTRTGTYEDHSWNYAYEFDENMHWKTCSSCEAEANEKASHVADNGGACSTCGYPIAPTEGINYEVSSDGTYATVTSYSGTATKVRIASTYNGVPVRVIGERAFNNNKAITFVIIPDGVTSIEGYEGFYEAWGAFYGCKNLNNIVIPDSITSIEEYAFYCCSSLTEIGISDSVTSIGEYAFYGTAYYNDESNWVDGVLYRGNYLIDVKNTVSGECVIKDGAITIADSAFYGCTNLTSVVIPDGITTIGSSVFDKCYSLKTVTIGNGVTCIGSYAFSNCDSLTSVFVGKNVTEIGNSAFSNCDSLTNVYITELSNWCSILFYNNTSNPLYYASNFYLKDELVTELVIPNDVTVISKHAFCGYDSLTSLVIGDSVTSIGEAAFDDCDNLTSVVISENVTTIGNSAFHDCDSLTSIVIPDSVTTINAGAFSSCDKLANVVIPDSVTTIGDVAFSGCYSLTSITIPDSVTSIGYQAFCYCSKLTSITISNSVTTISADAFRGCSKLTDVYYTGSKGDWTSININFGNDYLKGATIHYNYVPEE